MQYDYRQVYANLLRDWMLVDEAKIKNDIFFKEFINENNEDGTVKYAPLPLAQQVISGVTENFISKRFNLEDCYPNPANESTTIKFTINATQMVYLNLKDLQGRTINTILAEEKTEGTHEVAVNVTSLPPGTYFYQLKTGFLQETKKLIVIR
jgi:Secretion system C-terminal sorting domain